MVEKMQHIFSMDVETRFCTFYDRRNLGDFIFKMFPIAPIHADLRIQFENEEGEVITVCHVNDVLTKGREYLMCI